MWGDVESPLRNKGRPSAALLTYLLTIFLAPADFFFFGLVKGTKIYFSIFPSHFNCDLKPPVPFRFIVVEKRDVLWLIFNCYASINSLKYHRKLLKRHVMLFYCFEYIIMVKNNIPRASL